MNGCALRPYQEKMVQAWLAALDRGVTRGLIVAATGTGKTTVFSAILHAMGRDDSAFTGLVVAHRQELLGQAASRIAQVIPGASVALHSGESSAAVGSQFVVASVQSIGRAASRELDWLAPSVVVVDEAHHAAAVTYQNVLRRFGCYDGSTPVLGVTATPHRLDNLAVAGSERAIFQEIVFSYDIVSAIKDGYLADVRGYRAAADMDLSQVKTAHGDYVASHLETVVNTSPVNELAFKSWSEVAADRQTIVFCTGIDHAKDLAEVFRANGVSAEPVYGDMHPELRRQRLRDFTEGRLQVVTNVQVLTEGFDAQSCSCILLLRPTKSWSLYTQMVGRGLRPLPGVVDGLVNRSQDDRRHAIATSKKPDCIIVDIVGNVEAHKLNEDMDGGGTPSLQGLVGLPSALDLEGRTISQSLLEFEQLPDSVKNAAFNRRTSFSGLGAMLTAVELIKELEVPDEVMKSGAALYWMKVGEDTYIIDCGSSAFGGKHREATLTRDIIGRWHLRIVSENRDEAYDVGSDDPFRSAEGIIRKTFFGVERLASRSAEWRSGAVTTPQFIQLRALGVDPSVVGSLDRGKASALIATLQRKDPS